MLSGHRSAWRRRGRNSRAARIAVPLAIPMALGLTLGIILAVSGGPVTTINQSATGACGASASPAPSASPSASAPAGASAEAGASADTGASADAGASAEAGASTEAGASAVASPCPSASASADPAAAAVVPPAATFANGPTAFFQLGNLATNPVDGTGAAINLNQTAAEAATSMNCTLAVPNHPLSARGLATPWQLGDGCTMADAANEGAFVEATILAPNGSVQIYDPLVITAGTTPAAAPVAPTIPAGSAVIIDVGSNGNNLVLEGRGARQGHCVDALGQSVIGQVSACNAVNFYRAANAAMANGTLTVPAAGTAADGQPCETVRSFALIDQDQSDNVITTYLINANGQTAQDTAANANALAGATPIANGSDDRLLADFVDPANGCTAYSAANTTDAVGTSGSQALNELSARVNQTGTIAVVPVNDEMTLVNSAFSIAKTNVYRSLVDQPLLAGNTDPNAVAADYCQNMVNIAPARNQLDATRDTAFASPVPATGVSLASFLGARLAASFGVLGCANFGLTDPVSATVNGAGAATAVAYNLAQQKAAIAAAAGGTTTPAASPAGPGGSGLPWFAAPPRRYRHHQNGTGM
jgi:hypothetical protein